MKSKKMDRNLQLLLALLKEAVTEERGYSEPYLDDDTDWELIDKLARRNKLVGMLYEAVSKHDEIKRRIPQYVSLWKGKAQRGLFLELNKYAAIKQIVAEAEKAGILMVFFKGLVLADLYPKTTLRYSSDTDIFVYKKDREQAVRVLSSLGYVKNEEHSKENVPVFVSAKFSHIVELHYSLWEDYDGKTMRMLDEMGLTREESLLEIEACQLTFMTLGHEQHFIYQLFHIIKHFVTDSIGVRYLIDITLFVNEYGRQIDYTYFWEQMKRLGYEKFCVKLFHLCVKYFDMDDNILGQVSYEEDGTEEILLMDILHKGLLFEDKTSPWQLLGIMTPYLEGEEEVPLSSFKRKLKVLFPSAKALPVKFAYAKAYPLLLPAAWIHKMIDFIIRYNTYNKVTRDWYTAKEKLTVAEYRLALMKKVGL